MRISTDTHNETQTSEESFLFFMISFWVIFVKKKIIRKIFIFFEKIRRKLSAGNYPHKIINMEKQIPYYTPAL